MGKKIHIEFERTTESGYKRPEYHFENKSGSGGGTGSSMPPRHYNQSTGCLVPFILMVTFGSAIIGGLLFAAHP